MSKIKKAAQYYVQQEIKGIIDHEIDTGDMERAFIAGAEWQKEQSPWISVKDRLPDNNEMVLCRMKSNNAIVSGYIMKRLGHKPEVLTAPDFHFEDLLYYEPEAWMPIPVFEE